MVVEQLDLKRLLEERASGDKRMEFAVFSARVDSGRRKLFGYLEIENAPEIPTIDKSFAGNDDASYEAGGPPLVQEGQAILLPER